MPETNLSTDRFTVIATSLSLILFPTAITLVFASLILRVVNPPDMKSIPVLEENYESPNSNEQHQDSSVDFWVELAGARKENFWRKGRGKYSVNIGGSEVGKNIDSLTIEQKDLYWFLKGKDPREIRISPKFPEKNTLQTAQAIALYFRDDAWNFRALRIDCGNISTFVSGMYPGKWVYLPIEKVEPAFDEVAITIKPIMGDGMMLSALAVLRGE